MAADQNPGPVIDAKAAEQSITECYSRLCDVMDTMSILPKLKESGLIFDSTHEKAANFQALKSQKNMWILQDVYTCIALEPSKFMKFYSILRNQEEAAIPVAESMLGEWLGVLSYLLNTMSRLHIYHSSCGSCETVAALHILCKLFIFTFTDCSSMYLMFLHTIPFIRIVHSTHPVECCVHAKDHWKVQ